MHFNHELESASLYEPDLFRSAQRFFIANESRFLDSGVMPPRFRLLDATGC